MSEMVERAAKAVYPLVNVDWDDARGVARAALLAALDFSEDRAGFNLLRTAIAVADDGHPDGMKYGELTKAVILALRDSIRSPQAELGVKTDG